MRPLPFTFTLFLAVLAAPTHGASAQAQWIHGSWVNVRATAAADGPVLDHVVTNTPVTLRARHGASCEIGWSQDGADAHGFVPCKLLGDQPLALADVADGVRPDGSANPHYSPLRAFWLGPSMARLFEAGRYFTQTLLSQEQRAMEDGMTERPADAPPPRLVRYPVPEFEAMKALLAKGIVAPRDAQTSCAEVAATDDKAWRNAPARCRLPGLALRLPQVRPSLFKDPHQVLAGDADIERIGAQFGIVEHGKTVGKPRWERDYDTMRYTGSWDIGNYELTLDQPVVEHVIGRTGLVGAYQWTPQLRITPSGADSGCAEGMLARRRGKRLLPDYPAVKDALLWFQAPQALPFKKASIKSHVERTRPTAKEDTAAIKRVAVYEIDLDGDGVPDFVQWDIWGVPEILGGDPILAKHEVYVNVGGTWYPLAADTYAECT